VDEDVVDLLVRMVCGEDAEPPLVGTVELDGDRFRVWKHGPRMRIETLDGQLASIREADRVLTWVDGQELPIALPPQAYAFDDEEAAWNLLRRMQHHELDLSERRVAGPVERGERFGRPTATVTLDHTYHEDSALTLVVDALNGMPYEVIEDGDRVLRWLEVEIVDAVDEDLLRWEGETSTAGWFAYTSDLEVSDDSDESLIGGVEWFHPVVFRRERSDAPWPQHEMGSPAIVAQWSDATHDWQVSLDPDDALSEESHAAVVEYLRRGAGSDASAG